MDHQFKQDYIIIRTPKTVDGQNIEIDDQDRGVFKEIEAPIASLRDFELMNEKLPKARKMKITVVRVNEQISKPAPKVKQAEVETEAAEEVKEPAKRGPKPKQHDLD